MAVIYDIPDPGDPEELYRCWSCWRLLGNGLTGAGQICADCAAKEQAAVDAALRDRLAETITDIVRSTAGGLR